MLLAMKSGANPKTNAEECAKWGVLVFGCLDVFVHLFATSITPQKSNIDTKHGHIVKESTF